MRKDQIKAFAGAAYSNRTSEFTIPLSWSSCLALRATFGEDLVVGSELLEWATNLRTDTINPSLYWRSILEGPNETELDAQLFPHQRADIRFIASAKQAIIANGLGSGKTRSAVASLKHQNDIGTQVTPVLVACPNSTKVSWSREIKEVWPDAKVTIIQGTATERVKQFKNFHGTDERCLIHEPLSQEEAEELAAKKAKSKSKAKPKEPECTCPKDFLIINWEAIKNHSRMVGYGSTALKKCIEHKGVDPKVTAKACQVHPKELNDIVFNSVIGDELHRISSPDSQQTRAFKAATGDALWRIGLTGTPINKSPEDLWSLLNWLKPLDFPSKVKYMDRYLEMSYNPWGAAVVTGLKTSCEQEFFNIVDPVLRRMPKEAILPFLPPVLREQREVVMSAKQQKAYDQMTNQMIAELDDGTILISDSPLVKMKRLLQFSASYAEVEYEKIINKETKQPVIDPETGIEKVKAKVTLTEPSATLDAFMEDIDGFGEESVVVFAPSSQLINLLSVRMRKAGIKHGLITGETSSDERQFHMDNFQKGAIQFILCTTGAGGTGITLNHARIAAYLYRPYSMIESEQSEGRVHRIGSEIYENVLYIDYVTRGTVQEGVFTLLQDKTDQLETILRDKDLMRRLLNNEL